MYHDDVEYAAKRLDNSLVRKTNGHPFLVSCTKKKKEGIFCIGTNLYTLSQEEVFLEDLNLLPVPLGFFNLGGKMIFACRKPMRKDWKQGLSVNNLVLYGAEKRSFAFPSLTHSIMGIYPTYEDAIVYTRKTKNRSMAFSRDFGISNKDNTSLLIYRKYIVGEIKKDVGVLFPNKYFLEQSLNLAMKH